MRADIHSGQEHKRSNHGPDTEAQDQSPPSLTSGLQHTAGPYKRVTSGRRSTSDQCPLFPRKQTFGALGMFVKCHCRSASPDYYLIAEAVGQAVTMSDDDLLMHRLRAHVTSLAA